MFGFRRRKQPAYTLNKLKKNLNITNLNLTKNRIKQMLMSNSKSKPVYKAKGGRIQLVNGNPKTYKGTKNRIREYLRKNPKKPKYLGTKYGIKKVDNFNLERQKVSEIQKMIKEIEKLSWLSNSYRYHTSGTSAAPPPAPQQSTPRTQNPSAANNQISLIRNIEKMKEKAKRRQLGQLGVKIKPFVIPNKLPTAKNVSRSTAAFSAAPQNIWKKAADKKAASAAAKKTHEQTGGPLTNKHIEQLIMRATKRNRRSSNLNSAMSNSAPASRQPSRAPSSRRSSFNNSAHMSTASTLRSFNTAPSRPASSRSSSVASTPSRTNGTQPQSQTLRSVPTATASFITGVVEIQTCLEKLLTSGRGEYVEFAQEWINKNPKFEYMLKKNNT